MKHPERIDLPDASPRAAIVYANLIGRALPLADPDAAYAETADRLGADRALVAAFADVESPRRAFFADGRPSLLFEPHIFHEQTHGAFTPKHPRLSSARWNRDLYGSTASQHAKLTRARRLDDHAALKSCSWGRFQIMGFNYQRAGHRTLRDFVLAMCHSEMEHLRAFESFIRTDARLHSALVAKDFATMARIYNGPGYKTHAYDKRIEAAYQERAGEAEGEDDGSDEDEPIESVAAVQRLVLRLGFDPGPRDGVWGPRTRAGLTDAAAAVNVATPANLRAGPKLYEFATRLRDASKA